MGDSDETRDSVASRSPARPRRACGREVQLGAGMWPLRMPQS